MATIAAVSTRSNGETDKVAEADPKEAGSLSFALAAVVAKQREACLWASDEAKELNESTSKIVIWIDSINDETDNS